MAISGILGAVGSLVSGMAAMQQASMQAKIAAANAERLRLQAEARMEQAQLDAKDVGLQNAGEIARQRTNMASSGLALTSPSLIHAYHNARRLGVEEQFRTQYAGNIDYTDYQNRANIEDARSSAYSSAAGFAGFQGVLGALGSFVGSSRSTGSGIGGFPTLNTRPVPRASFYQTPEVGFAPTFRQPSYGFRTRGNRPY
jgi:hypothetical protein